MGSPEFSGAPERTVQPLQIGFGSTRSLMDEFDRQFTEIAVQIFRAVTCGVMHFG